MAESQFPQQTRAVDPFASYNSNSVNQLTRMITGGQDLLFSADPIDVTYDTTSPEQAVVVTPGGAFKDDVWIQITANHRVDFTKSFNYVDFDGGFDESGYYYVVLEYTYVKSKPAPQASVKIIKPDQRGTLFNDSHILIKVVEVSGPPFEIVDILGFDPENPDVQRQGNVYKTSIVPTLPTFTSDDQGSVIYVEASDAFYFGGRDRWQALFSENIRINVDTTGLEVGDLIYVDSNGQGAAALSNLISTTAKAIVQTVGLESDGSGTAKIAGRATAKIQSGINVSTGDSVYLSEVETGTIVNTLNKPLPIYQYVGQALESGTGPASIEIIFLPGPPTIDAPFYYLTTTGLTAGQLCYIKSDGTADEALADASGDKYAVGVVLQEGLSTNFTGIMRISGEVRNVPIENGISISIGDRLYLSDDSTAVLQGRVTNVKPALYVQEVGVATSPGLGNASGTGTISMLFQPTSGATASFITAADVTFENLNANGDVGTGASQVAQGSHVHTQYTDIPSGETILFESDTTVTGYSLEVGIDDELVYISSGGAGGSKSGSTWQQPNHTHIFSGVSHNHSLNGHVHVVARDGWGRDFVVSTPGVAHTSGRTLVGSGNVEIAEGLESINGAGNNINTGAPSPNFSGSATQGGSVLGSASPQTWRPKGQNFTRQTRN